MSAPTKVVKTKLFIGNLDPATQPAELSELFGPYGSVLEASVIKDYGFVHFGSVEEAEKAVAALNNKEFHGKRLRVELSTSTVRHRPGQPEPASALRNSRARAAAMASGNGISRYNPSAPQGGVGPMRHSISAWARNDARPYDGIPMDPSVIAPGYGPYDRSRPYEPRSDPRQYYGDRRDSAYPSGYETSRDGYYPVSPYAGAGPAGSGAPGVYPMREYPDIPPHVRSDSMGYGPSRIYDRNPGSSPVDPYYGGPLPQGPSTSVESYHNYEPYPKYYSSRSRDSEYPVSSTQNPAPREYDTYPAYRSDPYVAANPHPPPPMRHGLAMAYQSAPPPPPPQQPGYPLPSQHRQQQAYGAASGPAPTSYAPAVPSYYGAQQRA